ncbi:MAG: pyrroline-5-carboxylate reductase family protein [Maricaulaceae bacterium]
MRLLLVGCGKMGGAMLTAWATQEIAELTVLDPNADPGVEGVAWARAPDDLTGRQFDVIVLAVKPQILDAACVGLDALTAPDALVVSLAAGAAVSRLEAAFPDRAIIRLMPNLPATVGKAVCGLYANAQTSPDQRARAEALARATGEAFWLDDEDAIDRITAVAGSGSGYVFEIARVYAQAAEGLGFPPAMARALVLQTLDGAVALAKNASDQSLEALRNAVTSPNGTTQAGLDALRRNGVLEQLFQDTLEAAYARAVELR